MLAVAGIAAMAKNRTKILSAFMEGTSWESTRSLREYCSPMPCRRIRRTTHSIPIGIEVLALTRQKSIELCTDWSTIIEYLEDCVIGRPREFDVDKALERAMGLFWRQGYEGTSLADLTRELGVTRPSLYAAFGSKEGLFLKALDLYEARAGYRQAALTAPTAAAYARALLEGAADLHGDKRNPPGCLGVQGALACAPQSDAVRMELARRRK